MNSYKITGTSRKQGAIGKPESFQITIKAQSEDVARMGAIHHQYEAGGENVEIKSCEYYQEKHSPCFFDISQIHDISDIKNADKDAGGNFFSAENMRFFRSRVNDFVLRSFHNGPMADGILFITSEQFVHYDPYFLDPRLYTVRMFTNAGEIKEISKFQEFATLAQAKRAAKEYSKS